MKSCLTFLTISSLAFVGCSDKNAGKPNLVFILQDDLGKEWLDIYGSNLVETPAIDELARTGMKFNNAYSMPQCTPSRVALLTGQYPYRNGWINHYDVPRWGHGVRFDPDKYPNFVKLLKNGGYKTCVAGKWQINDFRLEPDIMNDVGFDEYCMWTGSESGNEEVSGKRYWNPYIHTRDGSKTVKGSFGEDIFSDFIIDFLTKNRDEPMLVYYPMCLPHLPLTTTPAEPDAPVEIQHEAMVRYADFILGKLVAALEDLGIRENTFIFWTTDNGTANNIVGSRYGNPVAGGKTYLTQNGINAPFIVNCPGLVPEGVETNALVDFTDILPTFAELANLETDPSQACDGFSFADLITGKSSDSPREWALSMGSHPARIINGRMTNSFKYRDRVLIDRKFKYFIDTLGNLKEIIDLENDFYEQNNILHNKDKELELMVEKYTEILHQIPGKDNSPLYNPVASEVKSIDVSELLEMSVKGTFRPNKSPSPNEMPQVKRLNKQASSAAD